MRRSSTTVSIAAAFIFAAVSLPVTATQAAESSKIVFANNVTGTFQIYIMDPDGSNLFQLTNLTNGAVFPALSPDGQRVMFVSGPVDAFGNPIPDLFLVNVDGTSLTQLTHDGKSQAPRWSPDGSHIVFARVGDSADPRFLPPFDVPPNVIATMRVDGTGTFDVLTSDVWDSFAPMYTPDGNHIVFVSSLNGLVSATWIMNTDGSNKTLLTPPPPELSPGDVSADGLHIALMNHQDTGQPTSIFTMNIDGSGLKRLTAAGAQHDNAPSFSPDGTKIVFDSDRLGIGTTDELFTMTTDGTDIALIPGVCTNSLCFLAYWGPKP